MNEPADTLQVCPREAALSPDNYIQQRLLAHLEPFGRLLGDKPLGRWCFLTEAEVYFDQGDTFRLSVAGWRCDRVPEQATSNPVRIRPNWICDIYSANRGHNLTRNKRAYHHHGVMHYWIIDPRERLLFVNRWSPEGYIEVQSAEFGEIVHPEPFEVLPFSLGLFFDEADAQGDSPDEKPEKSD